MELLTTGVLLLHYTPKPGPVARQVVVLLLMTVTAALMVCFLSITPICQDQYGGTYVAAASGCKCNATQRNNCRRVLRTEQQRRQEFIAPRFHSHLRVVMDHDSSGIFTAQQNV